MEYFDEYVDQFGYHFNERLYKFAVSMMRDRNGSTVQPKSKEQVREFLSSRGVSLKNDVGHDAAYVHAMLLADCWNSSYTTYEQLALGVKDFLDDPDGYPEKAFDYFVMSCRAKGVPIFWDEFL